VVAPRLISSIIATAVDAVLTPHTMARLAHAEAFLAQMSAVMPPGYRLEIDGEILWLTSPDGGIAGSSSYWLIQDVLLEDDALIGAVQSLHQIQQEIAEETTDPWPATSDPEYRGFPEPAGQIVGDRLHLWFGDKAEPVLELQPIDLADVILRDPG
jgi:hypothetical protein